jgi:hypothetical protein
MGYFFGPPRDAVPTLEDAKGLTAGDAVLVCQFGHLGLKTKKWPVLGRRDDWDPADWPMPVFGRYEELTGRSFLVHYAEDDPNKFIGEELVAAAVAMQAPKDSLFGDVFLEIRLARLLKNERS